MTPDFTALLTTPPPVPPPMSHASRPKRHFRALFLSDMHLGSRACREADLLSFLQSHTADTIYLVGDIIDAWKAVGSHWTEVQHQILHLLLNRARDGVRLVYTPGNHDAFFRRYNGQAFGGIEVVNHTVHVAGDGTRYLVIHGDSEDRFEQKYPLVARFGALVDARFRGLASFANRVRRSRGLPDWSVAERVVKWVNDFVRSLDKFDQRLSDLARAHGADGIICGHYHKPDLHSDYGVAYANCGDWVENSTALAETASGRLLLLDWASHGQEHQPAERHLGFGATAKGI